MPLSHLPPSQVAVFLWHLHVVPLRVLSGSQLRLRTPMPYFSKNSQIQRSAFPNALTETQGGGVRTVWNVIRTPEFEL